MKVYLVGAGPGDPELLTLKGRRILEQADAVLFDHLAPEALLNLAPPGAERVYVERRVRAPRNHSQGTMVVAADGHGPDGAVRMVFSRQRVQGSDCFNRAPRADQAVRPVTRYERRYSAV